MNGDCIKMKKIEITVAKSEVTVIGNRYLYGNNSKPMTKGDFMESYLRKTLNPLDEKWYIKNSDCYDKASDIETENGDKISVKSGEFSLTEKLYAMEYTETEKQRIITEYENTVPSTSVAYAWLIDKNENEYQINALIVTMDIFIKFLKKNAVMTLIDTKSKRYKVKVKKATSTVIKELQRLESSL